MVTTPLSLGFVLSDFLASRRVNPAFLRRSLERNAAFLVPHLQSGLSVLDAGCGPGAITLGIARAVSPGTVTGLDIDEASLEVGRELVADQGVDNVAFVQASVNETGFPADSFDVAFAHAVLQHLADPAAAVRELFRVVRPGGLIALVDADHGLSVLWPENDLMLESNALIERLRTRAGTSPRVGRELGRLLIEAGCVDTWHRTRESEPASAEAGRMEAAGQARLLRDPGFRERALSLAAVDAAGCEAMAVAWEMWGATPGATWVRPWLEALARKPG